MYKSILNNKLLNSFFYSVFFACLATFVLLNFYTNGQVLSNLFYKIQDDWGLDFFVFLSNSSVYENVYIEGTSFNPPFLRLIALFIYRSMPIDIQLLYSNSAITSAITDVDDIRLQFFAILPFLLFVVVSSALLIIAVFYVKEGSPKEKMFISILSLFSIGVLFAIERGNYIMLAIPFVVFFSASTESSNKLIKELGLISIAIASGIKIYPCLFLILLFNKNEIWYFLRGSLYTILINLLPFLRFSGFSGIKGMFIALFNKTGSAERVGTLNLSSLPWTIGRLLKISNNDIINFLPFFKCITIVLLILLFVGAMTEKTKWKKYAIVTFIIILFTGTAHTYMLSFILVPLIAFLDRTECHVSDILYIILFLLLICVIPINSDYINSLRYENERFTILTIIQQITVFIFSILLIISNMACNFKKGYSSIYNRKLLIFRDKKSEKRTSIDDVSRFFHKFNYTSSKWL